MTATVMTENAILNKIIVYGITTIVTCLLGIISFIGVEALGVGKQLLTVQMGLQIQQAETNIKLGTTVDQVQAVTINQLKQQDQIREITIDLSKYRQSSELYRQREEIYWQQISSHLNADGNHNKK